MAPATSLWGRIPQLQWKHNAAAAAQEEPNAGAGEQVGWLEEGSQQWEALSFLALVFVGGLAPALCGQRTPRSQHRAAGQTP